MKPFAQPAIPFGLVVQYLFLRPNVSFWLDSAGRGEITFGHYGVIFMSTDPICTCPAFDSDNPQRYSTGTRKALVRMQFAYRYTVRLGFGE